jgi:hypothetical protein
MNYKFVHVYLKNPAGRSLQLTYSVRPGEVGQIWANAIANSKPAGLRERERFYNFSDNSDTTLNGAIQKLEVVIKKLNSFQHGLNLQPLSKGNLANSINSLHRSFVETYSDESKIPSETRELWSEFNILLHAIEFQLNSKSSSLVSAFPMARIVFTWNNSSRFKIPEKLFSEFDTETEFGTAYFAYTQVGREIFEIYAARDKDVPQSHIQPAQYFSADTMLWFGCSVGTWSKEKVLEDMKKWYAQNLDLKEAIGMPWGDPRLAIGQVPVGRLTELPYSEKEKLELILKISHYPSVEKIELE